MRVPDADLRRTCCAWGRTLRPRPQLARQVVEELKGICGGAHRAGPARDLGSSALLLLVSRETLGDEQVDEHLEALGCSSGCSGSSLLRMEGGTMLITASTSSHSSTTQLTSSGPSPGASCGGLGLGLGERPVRVRDRLRLW